MIAYLDGYILNIVFQQNTTNNEPNKVLSSEAGMKIMLMTEDHITKVKKSQLN